MMKVDNLLKLMKLNHLNKMKRIILGPQGDRCRSPFALEKWRPNQH